MMSDRMQEAINKQINFELYSSYLYMSMSAQFSSMNLPGFANWMHVQAKEEMAHVMRFYNHIIERGGKITFLAIEQPPGEWESPLIILDAVYNHEVSVTILINGLVDLALEDRDHATNAFLHWFINEQVEEEASALDAANKLKLIGKDMGALFLIDREMAARVFVPPADRPGYTSAV